ncbi:MAG TPA: hypothetical protein VHV47_04160, partial [Opitutaceae bacterium]|nr:hypothetical protein [Opitutaceae bacterium]
RDLAGFHGPLLAIWSDDDEQVPVDPNARLFRSRPAASASDEIVECRSLDHFLRPAAGPDGPAERARVLREFRRWLDHLP